MIHGNGGHAAVVRTFYWDEAWIIGVGDNKARKREAERHPERQYGVAVHPTAFVSPFASIGEGTVVMAGAVIQPHARIGKHCIVNTLASVDHHSVIGDYVHIAPGAHLCGNVKVGEGSLVGVGTGVAPNTSLPAWSIIKARRIDVEPLAGG